MLSDKHDPGVVFSPGIRSCRFAVKSPSLESKIYHYLLVLGILTWDI